MTGEETRFQQLHDQLIAQVQGNKEQITYMVNMQKEQGKKLDRIYETLIGNGSPDSIVARLLMAEQRQKDAKSERHDLAMNMDKINTCVVKLEKRSTNDYRTIKDLEKGQDKLSEDVEGLSDDLKDNTGTIAAWRNRAVGIGIGAGLGTSVIIYLLQKLIESAAAVP